MADCDHPALYGGMCVVCGKLVEDKKDVVDGVGWGANQKSSMSLKLDRKVAEELSQHHVEDRLHRARKLSLIVDLDKTVIHTVFDPGSDLLCEYWRKDGVKLHDFCIEAQCERSYFTRVRPGCYDFLVRMSKRYELRCYTMGTRRYAEKILNIIDRDKKFFGTRVLTQDESLTRESKIKTLASRFPDPQHMTAYLDDNPSVWDFADNLVVATPYSFFDTENEINAVKGQIVTRKHAQHNNMDEKKPFSVKKEAIAAITEIDKLLGNCSVKFDFSSVPSDPPNIYFSVEVETSDKRKEMGEILDRIECLFGRKHLMTEKNMSLEGWMPAALSIAIEKMKWKIAVDCVRYRMYYRQFRSAVFCLLALDFYLLRKMEKDLWVCPRHGKRSLCRDYMSKEGAMLKIENLPKEVACCLQHLSIEIRETKAVDTQKSPEDNDDDLRIMGDILENVHKEYYKCLDSKKKADTGKIISSIKLNYKEYKPWALAGTHLVFTGLIPLGSSVERNRYWQQAVIELGAKYQKELKAGVTTHLIYKSPLGSHRSQKINDALKLENVKVVSEQWLETCCREGRRVDETPFLLQSDAKPSNKPEMTEEQKKFLENLKQLEEDDEDDLVQIREETNIVADMDAEVFAETSSDEEEVDEESSTGFKRKRED
eukprot:m.287382 g.287382  ORF g.287382 m.287382 type:complete len:654 (-) comp16362_c1_seq10:1215-3176(-)